ncbi:MAG: glycosyltransferase family 2 protein [Proteobacteria bacterium]|nr:glycosyltransferase family 2 protein [Pseudomonadota bacterium]NCA28346.1 glycosyltransferase family 2 protein [Pseudomonadota bacterium]
MILSVIIPCFNEKNTIRQIIEAVKNSSYKKIEIIIIDDFSNDGTREILKNEIEPLVQKIIYQPFNQGKGSAIRAGIQNASGDIIIIQDADLEYDPKDYLKIITPIIEGKADVVYGSRFISSECRRVLYFWHRIGNGFLTMLSNFFTNLNLSDMETCYKAFRSNIIKNIKIEENRFGFEPEVTAKIAKTKCRIYEIGISYHGRTYAEGKKISWKDGFRAIYCILKYNLKK